MCLSGVYCVNLDGNGYISIWRLGMRRDGLRVIIEAWNQCNEVREEVPKMGSPRAADYFDPFMLVHRVTEEENKLGIGKSFLGLEKKAILDVDHYAAQKELYLGTKCQNGNMDTYAAKCPKNRFPSGPYGPDSRFPCFSKGCMNQPLIFHNYTTLQGVNRTALKWSFYGTWDLNTGLSKTSIEQSSFHSVKWKKELGKGSWIFHNVLRTSNKYPWLMLYLRSDATFGFSGGYHYPTRGMLKIGVQTTNIYLMDMGSCWKNNGKRCDGNVTTEVTRYSETILNPDTPSWCKRDNLKLCPPYHFFANGSRIHQNDTIRFPYEAYHMYCVSGNGEHIEQPSVHSDPYNYGYPTRKGNGWIGDPRTWELDVGKLSQSLYFYQVYPGTSPARRKWTSIDLGTEIYKDQNQVAEWTVIDFDILVPEKIVLDVGNRKK
ncbi:unnamed protein product [Withania somnifera]